MFNKQVNDPDVAGIGQFVEENFINVGIGDHPVQALNAAARNRPTAYHAEDTGRAEITGNPGDVYKFRSLTLRQLKDARTFFHNGSFTKVRDVVSYFNAGVPEDPTAGAAATLAARFTHPRGPGTQTGLGLTESQIDDVTDFLDSGLYDRGCSGAQAGSHGARRHGACSAYGEAGRKGSSFGDRWGEPRSPTIEQLSN